jgi:ELWxxDGT repeat protein
MRKAFALLFLICSLAAFAQTPYLVKDINTTSSNSLSSSSPTEFAAVGNKLFFPATTAAAGTELWVSDGTSAGTRMVADLVPGSGSSSPNGLRVVNGVLLFNAQDVNHGIELWTSDGTAAGTHLFMDINPGPSSGQPTFKFLYKNRMLFSADDGSNGRELWMTDGTVGGTRMLVDINPGSGSSSPFNFVLFGDKAYFFAFGGLWRTDGTEAGTVKVASVSGRGMVVAGSRLFFEGVTADTGLEPWISDGTDAGTHLITEILPGAKGSLDTAYFQPFAAIDNRIVFLANDGVHGRELWVSDGTAAGTRLVRDFLPGAKGMWDTGFASLTGLNGRAYFAGVDNQHGSELWVTDGTDAGTQLFFDLVPGATSGFPSTFTVVGGKLFFAGGNSFLSGPGMWVTDGSVEGTHRLDPADSLGLGINNLFVSTVFSVIDGKLYFPGFTPLTGVEPWVTDGTDAGTHMIANIAPDSAPSSIPRDLTAAGNLLFFYATEGTLSPTSNIAESSLWRTDGTSAGTFKLKETGQGPADLVAAGSVVLFPEQINSSKLWMSDGTVAGTKQADDVVQRFGSWRIGPILPGGDTLFATVSDAGGSESTLWKMTGTDLAASAVPLGATKPFNLVDDAGHPVFFATPGPADPYRYGLWTSDGTPEGTYAFVPDLGDTLSQRPGALVNADGTLFFSKMLSNEKPKLWKSDGTFDGTVMVKEMPGGVSDIAAAGHRVFFRSAGSLWTSDGTEAGTIELVPVKFYTGSSSDNIVAVGDRVIFAQFDDATGFHLWTSDGTPQGTKFLLDLGRIPLEATTIDGLAYFAGADALHGTEPWTTDGTPEGTKLLVDLNPGAAGSNPFSFRRVGNLVYFTAYTDTTGYELWALPLTDPVLSINDTRASEDSVAHFTVSLAPAAKQAVTVDYATSDGAARAGEDYDAASGTLTFAAGETSKTIDVHVRGDAATENDETFFVTLRNTHGARVVRADGFGIIEDDDQLADVSVAPRFDVSSSSLNDAVTVSNSGPRAATDIVVKTTATPAYGGTRCATCQVLQLASGQSQSTASDYWPPHQQAYLSATATARQRDPQPSNNATAWTINGNRTMAMNAAFLTTGATATVTAEVIQQNTNVTASDASVISLGSVTQTGSVITFPVTALKPGTSTITLSGQVSSIAVTVVAPGATPRWPGAVSLCCTPTVTSFDAPVTIVATATGTAPVSGAKATGTIVVTAAGEELARGEIGATGVVTIPIYFRKIGNVTYTIAYAGDANFLPQSVDSSVSVGLGRATLNATLVPVAGAAGTFALTVEATGSPVVPPTGTLSVLNGTTEIAKVQLVRTGTTSIARATLTNLPATPSLTVNYPGDPFYISGSQQVRVVVPRSRAARP